MVKPPERIIMRFDRTNEKEAIYMVSVYGWNVQDHYCYHYYKDAKRLFDEIKNKEHESGTVISIYDIKKDVRKEFVKL